MIVTVTETVDGVTVAGSGVSITVLEGASGDPVGTAAAAVAAHVADTTDAHVIAGVTGLQAALDGKADDAHTHAQADVTGLVAALAAKAETTVTDDHETRIDALEVGGGGGAVDSVNGQTGVVVLNAADVGADATGTATTAVAAHEAAANPHPGYLTQAEGDAAYDATGAAAAAQAGAESTAATALSAHAADTTGVHGIADTSALVLSSDARLTDSRTPTAHAASHAAAGSDPVTLAQSQVSGLTAALDAKAPLASPAFTGNPTAPTPTAGDNDTSIATTAFVTAAVTAGGGGGSAWTQDVNDALTSLTGWTAGAGTWTASASGIRQALTGNAVYKLYRNLFTQADVIVEVVIRFAQTTNNVSSRGGFAFGIPAASDPTGGQLVTLLATTNGTAPSGATTRVDFEKDSIVNAGQVTLGSSIAHGTDITFRVHKVGSLLTAFVNGTAIGTSEIAAGTGTNSVAVRDTMRMALYAYAADVTFKNLKIWTPTQP